MPPCFLKLNVIGREHLRGMKMNKHLCELLKLIFS